MARRLSKAARLVRERMGRELAAVPATGQQRDAVGLRAADDNGGVLTAALLDRIAKQPEAQRKVLLAAVADRERQRCEADIGYWLDTSQHPGMAYVYTWDKRPIYSCNICNSEQPKPPEALWQFGADGRKRHLVMGHGIATPTYQHEREHFTRLSASRPFPERLVDAYARDILEMLGRAKLCAVPKSRDMMGTWMCTIRLAYNCTFDSGLENVVQSEKGSKALDLTRRVHHVISKQPAFLRPADLSDITLGDSKGGVFSVPSRDISVIGVAQGPDQVRYLHPALIWMDEAAFQPQAAEAYSAIQPAISGGGQCWLLSSAFPGFFQAVVEDKLIA